MAEFLQRFYRQAPEADVSVGEISAACEAIVGHPAETIIETARKWGVDLAMLGSHGYSGFTRFLLGSVSYAVVSHAPCSVEIVRKPMQG